MRKRWDDEKLGKTERVSLRFIQRASLAISCVSSPTCAKLVPFARLPLFPSLKRIVKIRLPLHSHTHTQNFPSHTIHKHISSTPTEKKGESSLWPGKNSRRDSHVLRFFRVQKSKPIVSPVISSKFQISMLRKKKLFVSFMAKNRGCLNDTRWRKI